MSRKPTPTPRVQATLERRRSSAYGTHGDKRTKRERTRSSKRNAAIREHQDA